MPERPNILIFMNDQEQAQVICPDHPCHTPNAERLASEGLRFSHCYTPTAHCCPARATFQTGLYPSGHGVYNNILNHAAIHTDIYPGIPTFGELLSEAGYRMQWSGKWHASKHSDPQDRGWEELAVNCVGGDHHGRTWAQYREGYEAGQDEPGERQRGCLNRPGWGPYKHYGTLPRREGQDHDFTPGDYRVVTAGLQGLDTLLQQADPWCLFIGPSGPHDPYIVPEKYATMYDPETIEMPANWQDDLHDKPVVYQRQQLLWNHLSEAEQREAVAHYWGYCTLQDDLLGMVMDRLDASGQADNTLLIFMSDHGDYNAAHGLWMKGVPAFDEAYRVPCVMRWPKGITDPGRVVDAFVNLADFSPTFLDLADLPERVNTHGRSLLPLLQGDAPESWRQEFVSQMNGVELYYSQRIVQTKEWKYVHNGFDWDELYHLTEDPHEMVNLAPRGTRPTPEIESVIADLCRRLWQHCERTNDIYYNPYPTTALAPFGPMQAWAE